MYDRRFDDRELDFEASGALEGASLVMRDVQTDSWWSLMSSRAIGGELAGAEVTELPVSEKMRWDDWRSRHPDTLVLSVQGREHVADNPYGNYIEGDGTFRGLSVSDTRLPAKEPVYAFWWEAEPVVVTHESVEGGRIVRRGDVALVFHRPPDASVFASTRVAAVPADVDGEASSVLDAVEDGSLETVRPVEGFDTYWYTWVQVNEGSGVW